MRIAIVGGTGPFGSALATRLREAHEIVLGSRDAARAEEAAKELGVEGRDERRRRSQQPISIVLATKAEAALDTARASA